MKSFEDCIEDFLNGVRQTENIDYLDTNSVRKNNKGVDLYRKSAKYISKYHSNKIIEFMKLLNSKNINVQICCAVCLIEFMELDYNEKEYVKKILQNNLDKTNQAEKLGWKVWFSKLNF